MIKKIVSIILALVLVSMYSLTSIAASVSELEDQKQDVEEQKEKITEEKNSVLDEISELNVQISNYENEIEELNNKIDNLESSISEKEKEIKELEEETTEREELLVSRLVTMYEKGRTSYLDVLLASESITSFLSTYYRIEELAEADQGIIDSIIEKKEKAETTKQELDKEKNEIDLSKAEVESKTQSLQNAKKTKQAKVSSLSSEEKELQEKIDEFESQIEKAKEEEAQKQNQYEYEGSFEGVLSWPLSSSSPNYNWISSYFGPRPSPTAGASSNHGAIDIPVNYQPVYSAANGRVVSAGWMSGYGNYIEIDHGNGYYTAYGHLSSFNVSAGQTVSRGQQIAVSGNTGVSTGPHLHFEVYIGGLSLNYRVDPLQYTSHPPLHSM